jgi:hypothetical protein
MAPESSKTQSPERERPLNSIIAAASRLNSRTMSTRKSTAQSWQDDAWNMYDLVGEERFLASTLANRLSQARLYVGRLPDNTIDDPEPVEEGKPADAFEAFGGSPAGRAQILSRLGVNLFMAGDGYVVGIPENLLPESALDSSTTRPAARDTAERMDRIDPLADGSDPYSLDLDEIEWFMRSVSEVKFTAGDEVEVSLGETAEEKVTLDLEQVILIRVWRPHPRKWWQADSPARSSLPVLRELVGLTMHVSAQVDSRLAGAGLLLVPQSASEAIRRLAGITDADDSADPFIEALLDSMINPIEDRSNASAVVPLVTTVPDETIEKFRYLSFATPLDAEARELREEAIRRLALGQDAPPEILLGVGGMNHWGAWLVREDTINTHIEPPLALICDALTTQYLWPVLEQQGMKPEEAHSYVIWYDVSHLIMRPNRSEDAVQLYDRNELSGDTLRESTGFSEVDAGTVEERVTQIVLSMIKTSPALAGQPGIPTLTEQITELLTGKPSEVGPSEPVPPELEQTTPEVEAEPAVATEAPPDTETAPPPPIAGEAAPPPSVAASSGPHLSFATHLEQPQPLISRRRIEAEVERALGKH